MILTFKFITYFLSNLLATIEVVKDSLNFLTATNHGHTLTNIEAIYKKLEERRDTADVTELLKELQLIVNEAVVTHQPIIGQPQSDLTLLGSDCRVC